MAPGSDEPKLASLSMGRPVPVPLPAVSIEETCDFWPFGAPNPAPDTVPPRNLPPGTDSGPPDLQAEFNDQILVGIKNIQVQPIRCLQGPEPIDRGTGGSNELASICSMYSKTLNVLPSGDATLKLPVRFRMLDPS